MFYENIDILTIDSEKYICKNKDRGNPILKAYRRVIEWII